jgi:anti-sigma factor RsiW
MTEKERNLLNRRLDGSLSAPEREELDRMLTTSASLREEMAKLERLHGRIRTSVHASGSEALRPFFSDRLMRRLKSAEAQQQEFAGSLVWVFRRVAIAGLAAIIALAAYNIATPGSFRDEQTPLEAAFSLPPVSVDMAYDMEYLESLEP